MAWSKQATILGPPGPAPSGTGLVKTAAGILVNPAALLVNADVDAAAAIAESKLALASDAAAETASRRTLGTAATAACAGNDARLTNARTPSAHAATHSPHDSDPIAALDSTSLTIGGGGLLVGTIPSVYVVGVPDAVSGDVDVTPLAGAALILDVWVVKTGATGVGYVNTVQVKNGSTAVTEAMSIAVTVGTVVRAATIMAPGYHLTARGTLRITRTKGGGNAACNVFVLCYNLAA